MPVMLVSFSSSLPECALRKGLDALTCLIVITGMFIVWGFVVVVVVCLGFGGGGGVSTCLFVRLFVSLFTFFFVCCCCLYVYCLFSVSSWGEGYRGPYFCVVLYLFVGCWFKHTAFDFKKTKQNKTKQNKSCFVLHPRRL